MAAINAIGEGPLSDSASFISAQVPYQPALPTRKSSTATTIEVEWSEPLSGGSPILGYLIFKNGIQVGDVSPDTHSFAINSGLTAGMTY